MPSTRFDRARTLGPGHMESGISISTGRTPGDQAKLKPGEETQAVERRIAPPAPSAHFRAGLTERWDGGIQVSPSTVDGAARYGIRDEDSFMMALVGHAGYFTTIPYQSRQENNQATSSLYGGFSLPLATRLSWFAEVLIRPNIEFFQIFVERDDPMGRISRSYWSTHGGISVGASFAAWRFRISPEINFLALYRSDHNSVKARAYPGLGIFLAY